MSKVIDAITAHRTDKQKVLQNKQGSSLFDDIFDVSSTITSVPFLSATEYKICVTLGSKTLIGDSTELRTGNHLDEAIKRTKQHVIEAIFGEFREDMIMIERAVYDYNFEAARNHLRNMQIKMFSSE